MSIRFRLTLLYSAILALTLFIFGLALYTIQAQSTLESLKRDLTIGSDRFRRSLQWQYEHPEQKNPEPGRQPPPPPPEDMLSGEGPFKGVRERDIVRVLDTGGSLVASPLGVQGEALPLDPTGLQALNDGKVWWETAAVNDERMLIYNQPIVMDGKVILIVQSARSLTERDRSLASLGTTLLVASLVTILVAFGIGWWLAGAALNPIHRITQTARDIGSESDFTRRVDYHGPNDEVGELATTFNAMLSRLQDAYQRVSRALSLQRNFVADVSHELRTPLTTVRGNLALLRRDPPLPAEERADILADLVAESDRLIRLVNDLLVLARAEARPVPAREAIPLQALVAEACRQASQADHQREIIEQVGEIDALGDRDGLKQVLMILLDNALKYSQGEVRVTAEVVGEVVALGVHDDGPGISPDTLKHVFDRFYRGDADPAVPGFGLGLPIARTLIEGQGGSIVLHSQPGHGSTAWVYLPLFVAP